MPSDLLKTQAEAPNQEHPKSSKKRKREREKDSSRASTGANRTKLFKRDAGAGNVQGQKVSKEQDQGSSTIKLIPSRKGTEDKRRLPTPRHKTPSARTGSVIGGHNSPSATHAHASSESKRGSILPPSKIPLESFPPAASSGTALTPLQKKMRQKLMGAHFRHLNESLYTSDSSAARRLFDSNATFFEEYHAGFRQQVSSWPQNPVDGFVEELTRRSKPARHARMSNKAQDAGPMSVDAPSLPRTRGHCRIADLGCGDGSLCEQVSRLSRKARLEVLSYDLQSSRPWVQKADIADLPLESDSVNITILCLALMGTNWIKFIEEAYRILHWRGELWVAEIKSRYTKGVTHQQNEHPKDKMKKLKTKTMQQKQRREEDEAETQALVDGLDGSSQADKTDISGFVQVLRRRGFALDGDGAVDVTNKMFVKLRFVKALRPSKGKHSGTIPGAVTGKAWDAQFQREKVTDEEEAAVLKPCLYKTR